METVDIDPSGDVVLVCGGEGQQYAHREDIIMSEARVLTQMQEISSCLLGDPLKSVTRVRSLALAALQRRLDLDIDRECSSRAAR